MDVKSVVAELRAIIEENRAKWSELSQSIWRDPELSGEEYHACSRQVKLLQALGFEVKQGLTDLPTAFKAECTPVSAGKTFAFASEYDALAKIGHGCGHNLIATAGCTAGFALKEYLKRHNLPGKVVILGTPAEERQGGKVFMVKNHELDGIDAVMMTHPSSHTAMDTGSSGILTVEVLFHGRSSHAAGSPYKGINALDAQVLLQNAVGLMRQQMFPDNMIHGVILEGGEMANVIPDETKSRWCIRGFREDKQNELIEYFYDMVKGAALMTRTNYEINRLSAYRPRRPNSVLNGAFAAAMTELGDVLDEVPRGKGSSDFGDFSQERPGAHPYIRIVPVGNMVAGHSPELCRAAGGEFGFEQALRGGTALAFSGLCYLTDADFQQRCDKEFAAGE